MGWRGDERWGNEGEGKEIRTWRDWIEMVANIGRGVGGRKGLEEMASCGGEGGSMWRGGGAS